ncbi:MAG TPA: PKD domain-containing protein, partial [Acidimicrobiales bacterium]|nr:PKD domain-containing protein [Acidimicrobiales bacterium]
MTRNRWTRIPVAVVVLVAALAGMAPPAQAAVTTVLNGSFAYQGQGSHTRTFFEDVFEANIPDILAGAGKIKVGFALEATTKATVRAVSRLNVGFEGDLEPGRPLTVQTSQDSLNLLGVPELTLTTRPALRVVFDYEPDDTDAFECSPFQVSGEAPQATGDGDAVCGRFEVGLPDDALLLFEEFVPPYAGGSVALQADREIFSIPICAELAGLIGIGPLADICAIRLKAKVDANLSAGASAGYRATTSLVTDLALPGGGVVPGGLQLSDAGVTRWPSPDAVVQPFAVPCLDEGAPLYYRLDNNVYASRVDKVSLQAAVDFTIAGASIVEIEVGAPLDLLGEGNAIEVTATHQSVLARLGSIAADTHGPVVSAGGPYGGPEGSPIRLQAVGAGPGASLVECEPAAVTYEWTFDDGSAASGAVVDKTFADNQPSPHQATLRATDRSGNTTSVPFSVAVQNVAPTATITSPTGRPVVPLGTVVDFAASAADPGTEDVLTYHWDFG